MARVETITSHGHEMGLQRYRDQEDTDLSRGMDMSGSFLSQGRLRNPRESKAEKQLHVTFQTLYGRSKVLLLK